MPESYVGYITCQDCRKEHDVYLYNPTETELAGGTYWCGEMLMVLNGEDFVRFRPIYGDGDFEDLGAFS